jgi:hypothetical protein
VIEVRESDLEKAEFADVFSAVSPIADIEPIRLPSVKTPNRRLKLSQAQEAALMAELPGPVKEHFDWVKGED